MTTGEYEEMLMDCYSIPIVEVGALVIPGFQYINSKPTGECCKHIDNKKGNFSFNIKKNYAKCFTCLTAFTTINLVKEYKGFCFTDAVLFLYQNFPSYFRKKPFGGEYSDIKEQWDGLTNQEYMYLKLPTRIPVNGEKIQIREFAKKYPLEHDILLINTIINHKEIIENVYLSFSKRFNQDNSNLENIKKHRKEIYLKLLNLLEKGIRNKDFLKKINDKIDLKVLIKNLELKQKELNIQKY